MTEFIIFYSWQSDLPNPINRSFIEKALQSAAKSIKQDDSIKVEPRIDHDTLDTPGSPDISQTILDKIDKSQIFVCDVSIINKDQSSRLTPNPNVLIELGYAIKSLGVERVLMTMNTAYGGPDSLPFDLKLKRVIPYHLLDNTIDRSEERAILSKSLERGIRTIISGIDKNSKDPPLETSIEFDSEWLNIQRKIAQPKLMNSKLSGYMEICFSLSTKSMSFSHKKLLKAAEDAQIDTFGWPIGIIMTIQDKLPKAKNDGIVSEVTIENNVGEGIAHEIESYDYLALRRNGDIYIFKSIFEDMKQFSKKEIFFDTRINRVTEVILYCKRLYENLNIDPSTRIKIGITHGGLQDRRLSATTYHRSFRRITAQCDENEVSTINEFILSSIDEDIVEIVKSFCDELFILFGFQTIRDEVYSRIVDNFIHGEIH